MAGGNLALQHLCAGRKDSSAEQSLAGLSRRETVQYQFHSLKATRWDMAG